MLFASSAAPETKRVPVMRLRRQREIVGCGEVGQQRGDLERARQPERAAPPGRQSRDVLTGKMNGAGIRQQLPGELADQRGLAGAVRADDRVQLAADDIEREIVGGEDPAKPPHQSFNAKQGISHPSRPMMPPRPNSTIKSSSGPMISAQYSVTCDNASSSKR